MLTVEKVCTEVRAGDCCPDGCGIAARIPQCESRGTGAAEVHAGMGERAVGGMVPPQVPPDRGCDPSGGPQAFGALLRAGTPCTLARVRSEAKDDQRRSREGSSLRWTVCGRSKALRLWTGCTALTGRVGTAEHATSSDVAVLNTLRAPAVARDVPVLGTSSDAQEREMLTLQEWWPEVPHRATRRSEKSVQDGEAGNSARGTPSKKRLVTVSSPDAAQRAVLDKDATGHAPRMGCHRFRPRRCKPQHWWQCERDGTGTSRRSRGPPDGRQPFCTGTGRSRRVLAAAFQPATAAPRRVLHVPDNLPAGCLTYVGVDQVFPQVASSPFWRGKGVEAFPQPLHLSMEC
jgi:hypothetical protein